MNYREYLLGVQKFFGGEARFQVLALSKEDALKKGLKQAKMLYGKDNIMIDTLRVIKKLKPSFGEIE